MRGLSGQTFTGNITGVIADPNQAAVAGAEIVISNVDTGEIRRQSSNEAGMYTFSQLLPGHYSLGVTKPGFREHRRTGIELISSQTARIDVQLALGQVSESVEVNATTTLVDSQTANQTATLESEMVEELPLIARNPFGLVQSMAGVSQQNEFFGGPDQNWTRMAINGGREDSAQVLIDGIPASAGDWGGLIAAPGVGSVRELQVTRSSAAAAAASSASALAADRRNFTETSSSHCGTITWTPTASSTIWPAGPRWNRNANSSRPASPGSSGNAGISLAFLITRRYERSARRSELPLCLPERNAKEVLQKLATEMEC